MHPRVQLTEALKFSSVPVIQNRTLKPPMIPKYRGHDLSPLTVIISRSPKKTH